MLGYKPSHGVTALPAKSDSYDVFCLQSYQGLKIEDHLCINPILWIGLIHKRSVNSRCLKWIVTLGWHDSNSSYINYFLVSGHLLSSA